MKGSHNKGKSAAIDLGIAISGACLEPGERRTIRDMAHFCNWDPINQCEVQVSWQALFHVEQRALRKLRIRLRFHKDPILRDAVSDLFHR